MIHADMHDGNIMIAGDEMIVIDFDDAGFGWHQYDLAVILFAYRQRCDFDSLTSALVQGYRSERELSKGNLSWLPLFLLMRNLAMLGWINARPELEYGEHMTYLVGTACRDAENLV